LPQAGGVKKVKINGVFAASQVRPPGFQEENYRSSRTPQIQIATQIGEGAAAFRVIE
jgi:hypothetical protein